MILMKLSGSKENREWRSNRGDNMSIECYACLDKGIVQWFVKRDGIEYEYCGRCSCKAGRKFSGMPPAESVLCPFEISDIIRENKKREAEKCKSL